MRNSIANLGDYNIARDALKSVGGNWEVLYNSIGITAVAKETPKIFRKGCLVGSAFTAGILGACYLVYKGYLYMEDSKQIIEKEPDLKAKFVEAIEAEDLKENSNQPADDDEIK